MKNSLYILIISVLLHGCTKTIDHLGVMCFRQINQRPTMDYTTGIATSAKIHFNVNDAHRSRFLIDDYARESDIDLVFSHTLGDDNYFVDLYVFANTYAAHNTSDRPRPTAKPTVAAAVQQKQVTENSTTDECSLQFVIKHVKFDSKWFINSTYVSGPNKVLYEPESGNLQNMYSFTLTKEDMLDISDGKKNLQVIFTCGSKTLVGLPSLAATKSIEDFIKMAQ